MVCTKGCVYAPDECPSKSGVAGQSAGASSRHRVVVRKLNFTLSGMLRLGNEPSALFARSTNAVRGRRPPDGDVAAETTRIETRRYVAGRL
jgi:hypothetical protein